MFEPGLYFADERNCDWMFLPPIISMISKRSTRLSVFWFSVILLLRRSFLISCLTFFLLIYWKRARNETEKMVEYGYWLILHLFFLGLISLNLMPFSCHVLTFRSQTFHSIYSGLSHVDIGWLWCLCLSSGSFWPCSLLLIRKLS